MLLHVVEPGSGEEIILVLGLGLALAVAGGEAPGCYERRVVVLSRENTAVIKLIHSPRQDTFSNLATCARARSHAGPNMTDLLECGRESMKA